MSSPNDTTKPKKRGRKPKKKLEESEDNNSITIDNNSSPLTVSISDDKSSNKVSTDLLVVKKKRGRKPKPKNNTDDKVPKKRGRKPKEIFKPKDNEVNSVNDEAVILHLNIKNNNSNNNNSNIYDSSLPIPFIPTNLDSVYYLKKNNIVEDNRDCDIFFNNNKEDNITEPTTKSNIDISINTESINTESINYKNNDIIEKFSKKNQEYSESILSDKNKCISIFTEYSDANKKKQWPSQSNIDCLWCCFSFENKPFGIPLKKEGEVYHMYGNFCSAECCASYIFDWNYLNDTEKFNSYSMLNGLYKEKYSEGIQFAPSKLSLKKFGGRLTIEQYRHMLSSNKKQLKVSIPPLISIIPNIEETNITNNLDNLNISNLNSSRISKTGEILRLHRSKPLPDSNNTLENCMNLKLL